MSKNIMFERPILVLYHQQCFTIHVYFTKRNILKVLLMTYEN